MWIRGGVLPCGPLSFGSLLTIIGVYIMDKIKNHLSDAYVETWAGFYTTHLWYIVFIIATFILNLPTLLWFIIVIGSVLLFNIFIPRYFRELHNKRYSALYEKPKSDGVTYTGEPRENGDTTRLDMNKE